MLLLSHAILSGVTISCSHYVYDLPSVFFLACRPVKYPVIVKTMLRIRIDRINTIDQWFNNACVRVKFNDKRRIISAIATHEKKRPMQIPTMGRLLLVGGICCLLNPKRIEAIPTERKALVINEARASFA